MELKTYNFLKTIKMIKAIGITKKLKTGKVLLNNISFEVNKGEFVGITWSKWSNT
jgi:ABC-type polysaccharide/polyol phosphate transport system ATPase subunit